MKISEVIIEDIESRSAYIVTSMGPKILAAAQVDTAARNVGDDPAAVVSQLAKADPTPQGKMLQFIATLYVTKQIRLEDLTRLHGELTEFIAAIPKLKKLGKPVDINALKTREAMLDLIELTQEVEVPVSNKQQVKKVKQEGAKKIIEGDGLVVIQPTTKDAACFYGAGTKWCTAAEENNMFDHYNKEGPLYVIIAGNRKFQLSVESDQFMNEKNLAVSKADIAMLSTNPTYTKFVNMLIQKYYGKYLTA